MDLPRDQGEEVMCEPKGMNTKAPAERLSDLIEKETGARIEPKLLRLFLKAKWARITPLAHAVHDED